MELFIVYTYRTDEEQDELYAQGRTKPGLKVTNAKGGYSWHNHRRAIDVAFETVSGKPSWEDLSDDEIDDWKLLGKCGEKIGFEWGGHFGDYGHFQFRDGLTLEQVLERRTWPQDDDD
jgi:peptidoglycan L-alanyl-D-glutamate endopeptidase CwlK